MDRSLNRPSALLRFWVACVKANTQSALEYRTSAVSQGLGMFLSNFLWVIFFVAYFERFSLPEWGRSEVITLWSVTAGAFGLAGVFFGNAPRLAGLIARGELDFYLPLPKPVLLHVLASRMGLVSLGDLLFAFVGLELTSPSLAQRALFLACIICGAAVAVSFAVIAGSLAFWLGSAESTAGQLYMTLISFSTYPGRIFHGVTRVLLYTVVPAAFIAGIPVELLRAPRWTLLAIEAAAAAAAIVLAVLVFRAGLRRYTSGNLFSVRS